MEPTKKGQTFTIKICVDENMDAATLARIIHETADKVAFGLDGCLSYVRDLDNSEILGEYGRGVVLA